MGSKSGSALTKVVRTFDIGLADFAQIVGVPESALLDFDSTIDDLSTDFAWAEMAVCSFQRERRFWSRVRRRIDPLAGAETKDRVSNTSSADFG